jgi:hypothetical protein
MEKKESESSLQDRRPGETKGHVLDDQIDFSDIPESTPGELKNAVLVRLSSSPKETDNIA